VDVIGVGVIGADVTGADVIGADVIGADVIGAAVIGAAVIGADGCCRRGRGGHGPWPECALRSRHDELGGTPARGQRERHHDPER
jgi:hypothetical protein